MYSVLQHKKNDSILIRNKHLYRFPVPKWKPTNWDPNYTVFKLKSKDILMAVRSVQCLQVLSDKLDSAFKRRWEKEDHFDKLTRQCMRTEINSYTMGLPSTLLCTPHSARTLRTVQAVR